MATKPARVLPVAALLVLTLAGCGSKNDDVTPAIASVNASVNAAVSSAMSHADSAMASAMSHADGAMSSAMSAADKALADLKSAAPTAGASTDSSDASESKAPAAASSTKGNPCDLLTDAEVSDALGAKVTSQFTDHGAPMGGKQCVWSSATVPVKTYSLTVSRTEDIAPALRDAGQSGTTLYTQTKALFGASEPVAGIGDEAVIVKSNILARKGDVFISASTFFGVSDAAKAALNSLTAKAVAKI